MPESIGLRELNNQTSRVLRAVREEMAEYVVNLHGKPVAVLRPLTEGESLPLQKHEFERSTAEMKAIAQEVVAAWISNKGGVEFISEQRR